MHLLYRDEVVTKIQRLMSEGLDSTSKYRRRFRELNKSGDGKLSSTDFQDLLGRLQIKLTKDELSRILQRFDLNSDGVVDYVDFLRFITGLFDDAARQAKRVSHAAEELLDWVLLQQKN